jgi:uncharacterized membrane protein
MPTSTTGACAPDVFTSRDWVDWRDRRDRPLYTATLWPNRSLSLKGRQIVLGVAATGLAVPLLLTLGTPVFWGLLPFLSLALWLLWFSLRRNQFDGRLIEQVAVWRDEIRVERREPAGRVRRWSADPFHVRLTVHPEAKVEQYLTLRTYGRTSRRGSGREIELGAFLSPDERVMLATEIEDALSRAIRENALGPGHPEIA